MSTEPKSQKRPADVIGNAVRVMEIATGQREEGRGEDGKDKAAQSLRRKGGRARAEKTSPERCAEIARQAAEKALAKQINASLAGLC